MLEDGWMFAKAHVQRWENLKRSVLSFYLIGLGECGTDLLVMWVLRFELGSS